MYLRSCSIHEHSMSQKHYLVLHISEWERLKRPNNLNETIDTSRAEYFKALEDKSQSWLKNWPDTVQGVVYHVDKRNAKLKEREKKVLETFLSGKKETEKLMLEDRTAAIKQAKELIFEDSSYGRQLISALLESKAIEERDAQIEFNAKLKAQDVLLGKDINKAKGIFKLTDETTEKNKDKEMKQKVKQIALFNKEMDLMRKAQDNCKRQNEIEQEIEHNDSIKVIQEDEDKRAVNVWRCFKKEDVDDFMAQQKQIKETKAAREKYDDALIELWRKHADKVRTGEKKVFDKIHKDRYNTSHSKKLYDLLENIHKNEKQKYDDFIDKGIKQSMEVAKKKEDVSRKQQSIERHNRQLVDDENKKQIMLRQHKLCNNNVKCSEVLENKIEQPKKNSALIKETLQSDKSQFMTQENKLVRDLKEREKEPSPWSGHSAAHAQFFHHANETMKQCRYKTNIRKVIENYKKENNLGAEYI